MGNTIRNTIFDNVLNCQIPRSNSAIVTGIVQMSSDVFWPQFICFSDTTSPARNLPCYGIGRANCFSIRQAIFRRSATPFM